MRRGTAAGCRAVGRSQCGAVCLRSLQCDRNSFGLHVNTVLHIRHPTLSDQDIIPPFYYYKEYFDIHTRDALISSTQRRLFAARI